MKTFNSIINNRQRLTTVCLKQYTTYGGARVYPFVLLCVLYKLVAVSYRFQGSINLD